jgi:hypothetical protein
MNTIRQLVPAFALAAWAMAAAGADAHKTTVTTLASDRFVAGGSVRQTEPVKGDLIAAGGDLELEAAVQGDLVTAGGRVHVRERVGQGVYAAGGRVLIDAPVARNARVAGGHVEIGSKAAIDGNLSVAGGNVAIRGPVKGYVQAAGGEIVIDSAIDGDVVAACGKLELGPNARIGGSLRYRAGEEMKRDPAAQVAGSVERLASRHGDAFAPRTPGSRWTRGWFWTAGLVVLAIILAGALPVVGLRVGGELRAHPWIALLAGLIALVCVPAAALLLMVTIIGIPLGLLAILAYLALLLVGYIAAAVTLGDLALARAKPDAAARAPWRMGAAALAVLVLAVLARVPFVGGLVVLVTILLGMGALILAIPRTRFTSAPAAPATA